MPAQTIRNRQSLQHGVALVRWLHQRRLWKRIRSGHLEPILVKEVDTSRSYLLATAVLEILIITIWLIARATALLRVMWTIPLRTALNVVLALVLVI